MYNLVFITNVPPNLEENICSEVMWTIVEIMKIY